MRSVYIAGSLLIFALGCGSQPPADSGRADPDFDRGPHVEPEVSPLLDKPAPGIEQELLSGDQFSLNDQKDKVVILDFWATWCGPCVRELPIVAHVAEEYRDRGVALFCVNQREEADDIREFLKRESLDVAVSLDVDGDAGEAYGVEGIPTLVVIDQAGVVRSVHVGYRPDIGDKLRTEIDALLATEQPTAASEPEET
ncbi:MAG TPA: TlpA disulfide reductase family protein [Pirellulales bacterium]